MSIHENLLLFPNICAIMIVRRLSARHCFLAVPTSIILIACAFPLWHLSSRKKLEQNPLKNCTKVEFGAKTYYYQYVATQNLSWQRRRLGGGAPIGAICNRYAKTMRRGRDSRPRQQEQPKTSGVLADERSCASTSARSQQPCSSSAIYSPSKSSQRGRFF